MKKFLFIDTNIFIQCSFLEIDGGDDIKSLEKLLEILSSGENYLLLPEVTKLEIIQRLKTKKDDISKEINSLYKEIKDNHNFPEKILQDINNNIKKVLEERIKNYEDVSTKIAELFMKPNVVHIPLQGQHIAEAYKFFLTNKRPFIGTIKHPIQSDCLNIIALCEYLKDKGDDEFYFCGRDGDFVDEIDRTKLHKDITDYIHVSDFSKNLLILLRKHFGVDSSEGAIQKFDDLSLEDLFGKRDDLDLGDLFGVSTNSMVSSGDLVGETNETIKTN